MRAKDAAGPGRDKGAAGAGEGGSSTFGSEEGDGATNLATCLLLFVCGSLGCKGGPKSGICGPASLCIAVPRGVR